MKKLKRFWSWKQLMMGPYGKCQASKDLQGHFRMQTAKSLP